MLIKKAFIVAAFVLLIIFSRSAAAQSEFYVLGSIGNTSSDASLGSLNRIDDDGSSYSMGAGYAFNNNFSIEGAYLDFGSHDAATDCPPGFSCLVIPVATQADISGISLSLIGSIPLTDRLDAYGKIGLVSWDIEYSGISSAFDISDQDLLYGAGLRMAVNEDWTVFAELEKVQLDLTVASIGVSYHF
jgi:hypothetical protein